MAVGAHLPQRDIARATSKPPELHVEIDRQFEEMRAERAKMRADVARLRAMAVRMGIVEPEHGEEDSRLN